MTGACLLVKTSVWDEMGGLDEAFAVAFNDVDFCKLWNGCGFPAACLSVQAGIAVESESRECGGDGM